MKNRERLAKLRNAKLLSDQLWLANDRPPGTPFDRCIRDAAFHLKVVDGDVKALLPVFGKQYRWAAERRVQEAKSWLEGLGTDIARLFVARNSAEIHALADAVEAWKRHKPEPDKLRSELISRFRPRASVTMREIMRFVGNRTSERQARRMCADLGIKIKGRPGRPKP